MSRQSLKAPSDRLADLVHDLTVSLSEIERSTAEIRAGNKVPISQSHARLETKVERLVNGIETLFDTLLNELARAEGDPFIVSDEQITESDYENPDEEEEAEFTEEEEDGEFVSEEEYIESDEE